MSYAQEKFGNLPRILNRNKGTLEQRLNEAFIEVLPCQRKDFPNAEHHEEFEGLRAEATTEPGETGRLPKTIAKMTQVQRESMRDRLLDLARRVELSR